MSSLGKSNEKPNNEEVIDNLTKDVLSNLTVECEGNQEITAENISEETSNNIDSENILENSEIPKDFEESDSEDIKETLLDDFIDEEKLKDLEITLSEEDKCERHKQAVALKNQGNEEFKKQKYLDSLNLYTEGLRLCPLRFEQDRAVLYANRGASKAKLNRKVSAIEDCTKSIELNDKYIKAYLRRAKLYEDTEKLDESLADYKKILELDQGNRDAVAAQVRLPPLINERNEKLKTEMLGKLKDLGNVILRPFGLSTENFQMTQDPNTGGYSVNFSQNPK